MSNKKTVWNKAKEMADKTPEDRNRYVDFLRALSIGAVVLGHWILAAPSFQAGSPQMEHLLDIQPWSRWLTWIFQVMPVFFFVGGFSNGVSWDGAQKKGQAYAQWLDARFRRLLGPTIPLVVLWTVLGVIGFNLGVHNEMIRIGSQVSLVPVWFLAIYFCIVMLVPLSRAIWLRYGFISVVVPILLAVLNDWLFFNSQLQWISWLNYFFIWGAVHQLGYAWQEGRMASGIATFIFGLFGLIMLILLTQIGPYPLSLVGVPSQELSNTTPPKLPLIALAMAQIGFLLSIEKPMKQWLAKGRVWISTVLINGLIMPLFLWHSTIMMLIIGALFWLAPNLLIGEPGSTQWWSLRPVWVFVYFSVMLVFLPIFLKLEKVTSATQKQTTNQAVVLIACAMTMCFGLALLAGGGVTGKGVFGINWLACLLPVCSIIALTVFSSIRSE